jgi:hypothetical protein
VDVFGIANAAIQAVNPSVVATLTPSTGYTTNGAGKQIPSYGTPQTGLSAQVQPLSGRDLRQLEGINMNGSQRAVYLRGTANATVRVAKKGGDLITLIDGPNAGVWLVVQVLEQWESWVKVVVTLQNGS